MGKGRRAKPADCEASPKKESGLSRRAAIKSLSLGTLALGIAGASPEVLAQAGVRVCGSPESARKFIEGMLDERTRARIERNPHQVMTEHGLQVPRGAVPRTVKLPPAEDIRYLLRVIDSGQGQLTVDAAAIPVFLAFFAFFAFFKKAAVAANPADTRN